MYAALASQKNHMAVYGDEEARRDFEAAYGATGKRYDVGKSCVRFRTLADLPLELIGATIASVSASEFIERAKAVGSSRRPRGK
jgi:uncharacterized protein YdhG (YjbR/CyaY superfamily)